MTKLEFANKVLFQWIFIRLARVVYTEKENDKKRIGWAFLYWIVPLSGWTNDFKVIGKYRVWHFIKPKND